ncbi:hypothetical protein MMC20_001794 [Loxospora ochrophaea]|nr:hypothetical protein [Loxospora ochrophaea]
MVEPTPSQPEKNDQRPRMWQRFALSKWLAREGQPLSGEKGEASDGPKPGLGRRWSRKVVPGLPRPATFKRQNSERRERLTPVGPAGLERRGASVDRRRASSARPASRPPVALPSLSAPEVCSVDHGHAPYPDDENFAQGLEDLDLERGPSPPAQPGQPPTDFNTAMSEASIDEEENDQIKLELEEKWILNLSMCFRDQSPREKFFITYAETRTRWLRVTVSCDYRNAPPESLERDLQALHYQRDKSARVYESLRMSLGDIQFYDTVTNLKLETKDDRLHVHVTEDVNEIIPYPSVQTVQHIACNRHPESSIIFEGHMSGFVYKVRVNGQMCIKKEIPGPDSVDEFLYEINALYALSGSRNVITLQGLVVDDKNSVVKGLLIGYAKQGALVDILYDMKDSLPWTRRERWAKQIVQGLSEIHEAGFVQGDFTLSNIVIDDQDNAKIIDINRRGCPVGWEPPEISDLIQSGQRISMYIGVKSDLFQLGMVLWAIAEKVDEPERQPRPLSSQSMTEDDVPGYFQGLVKRCLSTLPKERLAARDLLPSFPELEENENSLKSEPYYIDPSQAVEREDLDLDFNQRVHLSRNSSPGSHTYIDRPDSTDFPFDGPGSYMVNRRGRQPATNLSHLKIGSISRDRSSGSSEHEQPQIVPVSPGGENKWEEINMGGTPYLVSKGSFRHCDVTRDTENVEGQRYRQGGTFNQRALAMEHVDSGLADMDLAVAGVGGHEGLADFAAPKRDVDDLQLDTDDRNTNDRRSEVPE